jgi:hypothetical protein
MKLFPMLQSVRHWNKGCFHAGTDGIQPCTEIAANSVSQWCEAITVTSEHHHIRELIVHGVAFCVAAGIAAIILSRYYWFFVANTESASIAFEAYLGSCFVLGGIGAAITSLFFWLRGPRTPPPQE